MRRPKPPRSTPERVGYRRRPVAHFIAGLGLANRPGMPMAIAVVAYTMSLGRDAPHKLRRRARRTPDDEEGRVRVRRCQDIENAHRPFRVRSVVERKMNGSIAV